jgi:hypothetical protein
MGYRKFAQSVGVFDLKRTQGANVNEAERFDWQGCVDEVQTSSFDEKCAVFNCQHTQMRKRMYEGMEVGREEHTAEDELSERCKRGNMGEERGVEGTVGKEAGLVGIFEGHGARHGWLSIV